MYDPLFTLRGRVTCYNFQMKIVFLYLNIVFVLANRVDPGEMRHYVAFHQCLQCLSKPENCTFSLNIQGGE